MVVVVVVVVDGVGNVNVGRIGNANAFAESVRGLSYLPHMLSFQKLDVYRRSIDFLALSSDLAEAAPRGNAALLD